MFRSHECLYSLSKLSPFCGSLGHCFSCRGCFWWKSSKPIWPYVQHQMTVNTVEHLSAYFSQELIENETELIVEGMLDLYSLGLQTQLQMNAVQCLLDMVTANMFIIPTSYSDNMTGMWLQLVSASPNWTKNLLLVCLLSDALTNYSNPYFYLA